MEQTRIIYETLAGKRVSDSHWSKTKKLMLTCELPLDKDGFSVLISLRKVSPRYFSKYVEIKDQLTRLGRELLPAIGLGITGKQFLDLIERLEIHPNQGTVSRWFRSVGGFKSKGSYSKQVILPVVATALIYKSKSQSNQLTKIGA
ncbi:hypothetical protein [Dolichospermum sp. UHCC 0259]|uniref:hypothetical protein n=1 Tax=Dolichospermum sp. UHCC 0259 TaxID=2590010 RepID=UPI001444B1B9|nr:hypothetical protein [Dolichospermum sp. UHCC 0259]MTJ50669.1 hypothetical protein [Dolichospermum sp. UHCC 0259]